MTPVIQHLRENFPTLFISEDKQSLNWTFTQNVNNSGPDFYNKIVPIHPILNMEYSILCHQLRHNLSFPDHISQDQITDQLKSALMLAELLEHVHLHYLVVPREVVRLRRQQQVYRELLTELGACTFSSQPMNKEPVLVGLSLGQGIRENTSWANWYRILLTRTKRVLNFLDLVDTGSSAFRNFVALMDKYTNPFFAYFAWCFFLPRLLTNLFLLLKHTIPGSWMNEKEKALDWDVRLIAQIQRRWFELGNDGVWLTVGLLNCFVLTGVLAPLAIYLSLFAFAFDVTYASLRAYVELNRLYKLKKEYSTMLEGETDDEKIKAIIEYQRYIQHRIDFEKLRLGLSVGAACSVFIAMCFAVPALVIMNPLFPLIGALLLIAIWVAAFTLTRKLEEYRPNDTVEKPASLAKLGFFAKKPESSSKTIPALQIELEPNDSESPPILSCTS